MERLTDMFFDRPAAQLGSKGDYIKQQIKDNLVEHKQHVDEHGNDMPEIINFKRKTTNE